MTHEKRRVLLAAAAGAMLTWVGAAVAQDGLTEQQKLLSKRAAEADAYRKLAEAVYGVQLNSQTRVRDFVAESDTIRGDVDQMIRGIRLGTPTWFEDGTCEVPAEVTVAKVIETLRSAHSRYYKGDDVKTEDFETVSKRIEKNVIKVVGSGVPRPDLPPDLPQGVAEQLGPAPGGVPVSIPEIWRKVTPQGRKMAERAAQLDALRHLAERIKGLRLTASTRVRDFIAESDRITTELDAFLVGAREKDTYLHNDELIAEVTMVVPTEQVVAAIKQLHSRYYKGDDVKGHDIEDVVKTVIKRDFEATGMGIPPPQFIRQYNAGAAVPVPDWAMGPLEAEGQGSDAEMGTPQGSLRAVRAAEVDARQKLAQQIAGLKLASGTVQDFTARHAEIIPQLDAIIGDVLVVGTKRTDTAMNVRISVPGMRVWEVVNDVQQRESRTRSEPQPQGSGSSPRP